jgi:hypothetical protein
LRRILDSSVLDSSVGSLARIENPGSHLSTVNFRGGYRPYWAQTLH